MTEIRQLHEAWTVLSVISQIQSLMGPELRLWRECKANSVIEPVRQVWDKMIGLKIENVQETSEEYQDINGNRTVPHIS